jgi:hypothetical protein
VKLLAALSLSLLLAATAHAERIPAWEVGARIGKDGITGWRDPGEKKRSLIASFRAPKDGKLLRGLHSFSENFCGSNGHFQRKALYGPQWIRTADGKWSEITEASFSHDPTGKAARLDRFMGVESGLFFLSHGGFVPGSTKFGEKFTWPGSKGPPQIDFAALPQAK